MFLSPIPRQARFLPAGPPKEYRPKAEFQAAKFGVAEQTSDLPTFSVSSSRRSARLCNGTANSGARRRGWPASLGPHRRGAHAAASASEGQRVGFAYCSALITSMPTNGSAPSTHASWPGGMVYDIPCSMVV